MFSIRESAFGVNATVALVLSRLDGVERSSSGFLACCPAHDDAVPSLSISEGRDGRALLHCFAGCTVRDIIGALDLDMRDLFPAGRERRR